MMLRVVDMMNLRPQFSDTTPALRSRQFETARSRSTIDIQIVPERPEAPAEQDENGPDPFPLADRMHKHPDLENGNENAEGTGQKVTPITWVRQKGYQGSQHGRVLGKSMAFRNTGYWMA